MPLICCCAQPVCRRETRNEKREQDCSTDGPSALLGIEPNEVLSINHLYTQAVSSSDHTHPPFVNHYLTVGTDDNNIKGSCQDSPPSRNSPRLIISSCRLAAPMQGMGVDIPPTSTEDRINCRMLQPMDL